MSTQASEATTVLPPADMVAMLDLSRFLEHVSEPAALLGPDGQTVPLPVEAYKVLVKVVASMRAGKAITIAPLDQQLTTQEAANFLGISRPTLVKLLDQGEISFERPASGRHRRVRLDDVLDYQRRKRASRRATLDELTEQAVEAGLYDQVPEVLESTAPRDRGFTDSASGTISYRSSLNIYRKSSFPIDQGLGWRPSLADRTAASTC